MRRRLAVAITLAFLVSSLGGAPTGAETRPPAEWPATSTMSPGLDGWPNAIRIFGANRYQTGLSAALTLVGSGAGTSYPYGSPDPSTADGWFGLDSCPRSVIVVAGDNPADALAASSLSDPTGQSSEPYLRISSAADQVFDPVGDYRRVDTDFAPVLVTRSTRQGATGLEIATRLAAQTLRSGECTTAREAIVVGGTSAVPSAVDAELLAIGYSRVFRIAGSSRYETARLVAESLGTASAPGGANACTDVRVDDGTARMTFYANSVVEYRESATECELLNKTVVLTDGVNGADALAAGWWTSFWQVPMLLHNGGDELPSATRDALLAMDVENVIVLGGAARISADVAQDAKDAAGDARIVRIAGADRYATSIDMAEQLGGWYAVGQGVHSAGSRVCIAASTGTTAGWPDALAAGPWCGRYSATHANAPVRALAPTTGSKPTTSAVAGLARPARDAVPVILTPASSATLSASVSTFLSSNFPAASAWCSSNSAPAGCVAPGFAVMFGGPNSIPDSVVSSVSSLVHGGLAVTNDRSPQFDAVFATRLDMSPVFADSTGATASARVCAQRDDIRNARWLAASGATSSATVDVMVGGRYRTDADGTARSPGLSSPFCGGVPEESLSVRAASLAGPANSPVTLDTRSSRWLGVSTTVSAQAPEAASGTESTDDPVAGGSTTWAFSGTTSALTLNIAGEALAILNFQLGLTLTRGLGADPDQVLGEFSLFTDSGEVVGVVSAEALLQGGAWKVRGEVTLTGGLGAGSTGGFTADLDAGMADGMADDSVVWQFDGLIR